MLFFFFMLIILILVLGLSLIMSVFRGIISIFSFGNKSKSTSNYSSTKNRSDRNNQQSGYDEFSNKIFGKDEGEYISFEEIK